MEKLDIEITSISGYKNKSLLEEQALKFKPKYVCSVDKVTSDHLKLALAHTTTKVLAGSEGLCEMVSCDDSDTVLSAIVGVAGLLPTTAAIRAGKHIALANKETLVVGGKIVTELAAKHGVKLLPVDSEHSAIFQCLQDPHSAKRLKKIILTASGGPFLGKTAKELEDVTLEQALNHPNWSMGSKITIDSATLMNKGLEIIEAMWLFDLDVSNIEVTVHPQSIIHSMVEFSDGSVLAQLGLPDMRIPIQYALTWPDRKQTPVPPLTIESMSNLTFGLPDEDTFRCLAACKKAAEMGGAAPCVANAANEQAVELFLERRIGGFLDIGRSVENAVDNAQTVKEFTVETAIETDKETRAKTREFLLG